MTVHRLRLPGIAILVTFATLTMAATRQDQPATSAPVAAQGQAFRGGVELVSLNVTVTDTANRFVTDLAPGGFSVYEDGVKQDVTFFNRTNLPIAVSLLVDTSASMEDKMNTVHVAASGFAQRLRAQDLGQLIDFNTRVTIAFPFTNTIADLQKAINATVAGGSTALYNAVYIALRELKKTHARTSDEIRRQAIILLSDGEDTSSLVSFDEVMDLAKRSETSVYAIGIRSNDPGIRKGFQEAEYVLRQLTSQTGGRVFFPATIADLPAVYDQISQELSSQYMIGYSSKNAKRDGAWRRVVVRVDRPDLFARTKLGYYGPTS
jgi:Ca-activated chloride channel family protein